ncbi:MAG: creatininase family protein [Comamonadaceae bacterium]|nr:creatininase family protein [Comamonadaceae bacterium]
MPSLAPASRYWADQTTESLAQMDRARLVAVLPLAATEQHGPHLPLSTDTTIVEGIVHAAIAKLPPALPVLFLPTAQVGKSNEHTLYPGTLTLSLATLVAYWSELAAGVVASGVRKLVFFNGHGGQMNAMDIVTRDLRERHGILVVASSWYTLGLPPGLVGEHELAHGIHGGELETSLMMALAPHRVRLERRQNFGSLTETLARENRYLSITPRAKIGWQAQDLNPLGACGDAASATAETGQAVLDFVSSRFVELLAEVDAYPLARLGNAPAWR